MSEYDYLNVTGDTGGFLFFLFIVIAGVIVWYKLKK